MCREALLTRCAKAICVIYVQNVCTRYALPLTEAKCTQNEARRHHSGNRFDTATLRSGLPGYLLRCKEKHAHRLPLTLLLDALPFRQLAIGMHNGALVPAYGRQHHERLDQAGDLQVSHRLLLLRQVL